MNIKLLLLVLTISLSCVSCISEYEERLEKAKLLKAKMLRIQKEYQHLGISSKEEIMEIESEIEFHARISGNEDLFLKELNIYEITNSFTGSQK